MTPFHRKNTGFTLIELIITIIIMSFAAIIIIPYLSAVTHSPDPVLREKAIALGQAMMDEILAKKWDENSPNGGGPICTSESTDSTARPSISVTCDFALTTGTLASAIGREAGELPGANQRAQWDDIDDYFDLSEAGTGNIFDQNGDTVPGTWTGFTRTVSVSYVTINNPTIIDATTPAGSASTTDTKRIIVTVTSPLGETFQFVGVSCNF
jgi:MSHA pilin protein MshD